jgi:hypothetical protein
MRTFTARAYFRVFPVLKISILVALTLGTDLGSNKFGLVATPLSPEVIWANSFRPLRILSFPPTVIWCSGLKETRPPEGRLFGASEEIYVWNSAFPKSQQQL